MKLEEQINNDIKEAMKARDKSRLEVLRAIKSAILLAKTEKGAAASLNEATEIKLLQRLIKQRKESAQIYKEQDRMDLFNQEQSEADIIQEYLPDQMDEETLRENIQTIIDNLGASSMADMGKVMGIASKELAGKAEGRLIAEIVRSILSG